MHILAIEPDSPDLLASVLESDAVNSCHMYLKETDPANSLLKVFSAKKIDAKSFEQPFKTLQESKDEKQLENMKISGHFANEFTNLAMHDIVEWFENDKTYKHVDIAGKFDDLFKHRSEKIVEKLKKKHRCDWVNRDSFEIGFSPLVQSGGRYDLKITAVPDSLKLEWDLIRVVFCYKYDNYYNCLSRLIFINAEQARKDQYEKYHKLVSEVPSLLAVNTAIKDIYAKLRALVRRDFPDSDAANAKSYGHGIGLDFKEKSLEINELNESLVRDGQTYLVYINVDNLVDKQGKYVLQLMNTYLIQDGKCVNLNEAVSSLPADVNYSYEEEEEEEEDNNISDDDRIYNTRKRKGKHEAEEREKKRQPNQYRLRKAKIEEITTRFNQNKLIKERAVDNVEVKSLVSYTKESDFPQELNRKIYLDEQRNTILIPVGGSVVPFHIAILKNVKTHDEGNFTFIRFNFWTPHQTFNTSIKFPEINGHTVYVQSLVLRGTKELQGICRKIEHKLKQYKSGMVGDAREDEGAKKEPLKYLKETLTLTEDVSIKPRNGTAKRNNVGLVQAHRNFIQFIPKQGDKVVILYKDVKHAFFQEGDNELTIVLHFQFKRPFKINGKLTEDVQFYVEIFGQSDEVGTKRYYTDQEEMDMEKRERARLRKMNKDFVNFCEECDRVSAGLIKFDTPYSDMVFNGIFNRNYVKIRATNTCLVCLTEWPVVVIDLADVDYCFFERVNTSNKNRQFDMTLINKDYARPPFQVSSIENANLDALKEFMNQMGVIYAEYTTTLNWANIMKTIREDPKAFIDDGCWEWAHETEQQDEIDPDDIEDSEDSVFTAEQREEEEDEDESFGEDDINGKDTGDVSSDEYQESEIEDDLARSNEDEDEEDEDEDEGYKGSSKNKGRHNAELEKRKRNVIGKGNYDNLVKTKKDRNLTAHSNIREKEGSKLNHLNSKSNGNPNINNKSSKRKDDGEYKPSRSTRETRASRK